MRNLDNSKTIQVSFLISILVHICLFTFLYSPLTKKKKENTPISVDFMSMPETIEKSSKATPSLKRGGGEEDKAKVSPSKGVQPAPPAKTTPASRPQEITKALETPPPITPEISKARPDSHAVEVPKAPSYPGIKELTPSQDMLAKIGKGSGEGTGEGGTGEETVRLNNNDDRFTSYIYGLKLKIEGHMRYPEAARNAALQGSGLVGFTILKDGSISDLKIVEPSEFPVFDEAILNSIRKSAPFNPLMDNMGARKATFVFMFEYTIEGMHFRRRY